MDSKKLYSIILVKVFLKALFLPLLYYTEHRTGWKYYFYTFITLCQCQPFIFTANNYKIHKQSFSLFLFRHEAGW